MTRAAFPAAFVDFRATTRTPSMAEEVATVWKTCRFRSAAVRRCGFDSISSLPMTGPFYRDPGGTQPAKPGDEPVIQRDVALGAEGGWR